MKKFPKVSIIIPLYVITDRFFDDLRHFERLKYPNFELLIVCDKKIEIPYLKNVDAKLIRTKRKHTGPAEKRDIALKYAKGEICAFIDDDAYPDTNWLKEAVGWMDAERIVAVGGPGVTPPEDNYWQKIGGHIIESYLCSGGIQHRFYPGRFVLLVNDYPAYNLLIKTKILKKVGGYCSTFYGGEDTLVCMKILKYGEILYDPKAIVYHHRRDFPVKHSRQIGGVGIHRGYFFKRYPETSRRIFYLLPTMLTFGLIVSFLLVLLYPSLFLIPFLSIFLLLLTIATISVKRHGVSLFTSIVSAFGIVITHIVYGIYFLKGFWTKDLKV